MQPRFASAVISLDTFVRQVYRCTIDEWKRLPVQWRGFVLFQQHNAHDARTMLSVLERGKCSTEYDPQGVFDAFQGHSPA
jgi:hypothetical protein